MQNNTYILLARSIIESDVFASQKLLKIWIWCLCKASHTDRPVPLKVGKGETTVKLKRGQFIFGRHKAEYELCIDGSTIYKAMQNLQKMGNISIKSNNQYSIITIANYDTYQDPHKYKVTTKEQPKNNQVTGKGQPSNTDKNVNKVNNDKNEYIDMVNSVLGRDFRLTDKLKPKIDAILKEFSIEEIKQSIVNAKTDNYHKETGRKYLTAEFFTRSDKVDKYLNAGQKQQQNGEVPDYCKDTRL